MASSEVKNPTENATLPAGTSQSQTVPLQSPSSDHATGTEKPSQAPGQFSSGDQKAVIGNHDGSSIKSSTKQAQESLVGVPQKPTDTSSGFLQGPIGVLIIFGALFMAGVVTTFLCRGKIPFLKGKRPANAEQKQRPAEVNFSEKDRHLLNLMTNLHKLAKR